MCQLDYPEYEIIFGVGENDDPVVPLIEKLQREFPERSIRLMAGIEQLGSSRKTNTLCRLVKEAKYDLLVMNDSDVRVQKGYLHDVVAGFSDPRVGVVTALFRSKAGEGLAEKLDAIGVPTESSASMLLERKFSEIDFAYGWTMAITKERLAEIGGFEAMVNLHSDDLALGNEMAKRGYRVELTRNPIWMVFPEETLGDFLKHEIALVHPAEKPAKVGLPRHVSDVRIRVVAAGGVARAVMEDCSSLFAGLFDAAVDASVGRRGVGPGRSCSERQFVACAGARCAQSLSVHRELLFQQSGMAR